MPDYFSGCTNMNQAKTRFRELAKKHHPDAGGDTKTFAEISRQMDAFNPSGPEHNNYFKSTGGFSGGFNFNANDPYRFTSQSFENNTYKHHVHVPFDHPIHEELRVYKKQVERQREEISSLYIGISDQSKLISELKNIIEVKSQDCNHKLTKIFELKDEINSLKSQIEVLSRPNPVTSTSMLDKIRRYFEK